MNTLFWWLKGPHTPPFIPVHTRVLENNISTLLTVTFNKPFPPVPATGTLDREMAVEINNLQTIEIQ